MVINPVRIGLAAAAMTGLSHLAASPSAYAVWSQGVIRFGYIAHLVALPVQSVETVLRSMH